MNMRNGKVQFVLVTVLLMVVGIWLFPSMTEGKSKAPPWQNNEEQRDGYSQTFVIEANSSLIEVPEGKCYVLLRLYSRIIEYVPSDPNVYYDFPYGESVWTLTIDGEMFLNEFGLYDPLTLGDLIRYTSGTGIRIGDFPDRCVMVRGGETLGITKHEDIEKLSMTLIGYFCDMP